MDWVTLAEAFGGSTLVLSIWEGIRYFRKDRAEAKAAEADADAKISDNAMRYVERVDERMEKLEQRMDKSETRQRVFQQAINCAFRCKAVEEPEKDCPVLVHLNEESHLE